jgi:hypothetical protein
MSFIRMSIFGIIFMGTGEYGMDLWMRVSTPPPREPLLARVGWNVLLKDSSREETLSVNHDSVINIILR